MFESDLEAFVSTKMGYRETVIESVFSNSNLKYEKVIGEGGFGCVVQVRHKSTNTAFAAKICLRSDISLDETENWPILRHENVLPLLNVNYFASFDIYVFLMPKLTAALDDRLIDPKFFLLRKAPLKAVSYLQDILKGLQYLHERKLCHLDIKCNNVLVSETDTAVLCDFGFLTATENLVDHYGSPFIYRPPETRGKEVNGYKYDVWTIGLLAIEMFTKFRIVISMERAEPNPAWHDVIYPKLFDILGPNFKCLVKEAFSRARIKSRLVKHMKNFVTGCISLNPLERPTVQDALGHKLFDGATEFLIEKDDVWCKRASPNKVDLLVWKYICQNSSHDYLPASTEQKDNRSRNVTQNHGPEERRLESALNLTVENCKTTNKNTVNRKKKSRFPKLFKCLFPMLRRGRK